MTNNVKKIFEILDIEPNEIFRVDGTNKTYYIDEDLMLFYAETKESSLNMLRFILNGTYKIIKLPKENKKKLRDLTLEEYKKWLKKNCSNLSCEDCVFLKAKCNTNSIGCWINHKDAYSEKFLNQEIEVENNA